MKIIKMSKIGIFVNKVNNGEIKFSEPLPFYETALEVSNLIISN